MKNLIVSLFCLTSASSIFCQNAGDIDVSFGNSGFVYHDLVPANGELVNAIATLPDDKIVLAGFVEGANEDILVAKLNSDGSMDSSFANNGRLIADLSLGLTEILYAVATQPDGKIVTAGIITGSLNNDLLVMRLLADGSYDTGFGTDGNGRVVIDGGGNLDVGKALHILADGSILVGGNCNGPVNQDMVIYKLNSSGVLDGGFGTGGKTMVDFGSNTDELFSITQGINGEILMAGGATSGGIIHGAIAMISPTGQLMNSFNGTGTYLYSHNGNTTIFRDIVGMHSTQLMAVGYTSDNGDIDGLIVNLHSNGMVNTNFSGDGIFEMNPGATDMALVYHVDILTDEHILVTGEVNGPAIKNFLGLMLDTTGTPNSGFGINGEAQYPLSLNPTIFSAQCYAMQSNGRILVGGVVNGEDFGFNNMFIAAIYNQISTGLFPIEPTKNLIFPNPVSTTFYLQPNQINAPAQVKLYSMFGSLLKVWRTDETQYQLPNEITNGVYLIQIESNGYLYTSRLVVKK